MTVTDGDSSPNPQRSRDSSRGLYVFWCCVAVVCLVSVTAVVTSPLPVETRALISQLALLVSGPVLAVSCGLRVRSFRERRSRAWLLLGLGACRHLAEHLHRDRQPGTRQRPSAMVDIAVMVALLFGIAFMISFPPARRRRTDLARMLLDGVVVGGSILFLTTVVVYPTLLITHPITSLSSVTALALPILDVIAATLAVLFITRSDGSDRPILIMVSIGFALYTVSDPLLALLSARETFGFGTVVDLGWIAGYTLIALAVAPRAGQPRRPNGLGTSPWPAPRSCSGSSSRPPSVSPVRSTPSERPCG